MTEFIHDPDATRRQANVDRAAGDVDHQWAKRDQDWEGILEHQHGRVANAFNVYAAEYALERETGITGVGKLRYGTSDVGHYSITHFEGEDLSGGSRVRNSVSDA
ncbi:hypothetical protein NLM24_26475 [Nocardia zapadnayensis]|nr:hypothetical protein [Nocardia zapadnayensis]MCX0274172.1 hypothetical protein [Nocardia zapadnayensis]